MIFGQEREEVAPFLNVLNEIMLKFVCLHSIYTCLITSLLKIQLNKVMAYSFADCFSQEPNEDRYREALHAASLENDLKMFPQGDQETFKVVRADQN